MKRRLCVVVFLGVVCLIMSAFESEGHDEGWDIESLIKQLGDEDASARVDAAMKLRQASSRAKAAVPALIQALNDDYDEVHRHAAEALWRIGEPAVPALIQALNDEAEGVRIGAFMALQQINTSEAMKAVKEYERNR